MRRLVTAVLLTVVCSWPTAPALAYTLRHTNGARPKQLKWPSGVITIALSTSLQAPPSNIKTDSDVAGAARRALARWSAASGVRFNVVSSNDQALSPAGGGNSISLITVSSVNGPVFNAPELPGRTRVFFNPDTGSVVEADIAINPTLPFSTDGTTGTYDLESVFLHEIGHLLGLEHSGVVGATMQPRQARNGIYELATMAPRTLAEDDRAGVRALYGSGAGRGALSGAVRNFFGPVSGAHVWAEEISTGKVMAGNVTKRDGSYRIEGLVPGLYRVNVEPLDEPVSGPEVASSNGARGKPARARRAFRTAESAEPVVVAADAATTFDIVLPLSSPASLNPRLLGLNWQLSTVAAPLVPGTVATVFVGGEGVGGLSAEGISVTSPFVRVNPASLQQLDFGIGFPVISFEVWVSPATPPGEYSLRLLSQSNEVAYITGGLTIEGTPGVAAVDADLPDAE
ncbi:MAG: matrixin family metalloprotease [Pyrinomonadaceae bacterium]